MRRTLPALALAADSTGAFARDLHFMERGIERLVEPRARADTIESELDYRLPGGEAPDLLRSGPE